MKNHMTQVKNTMEEYKDEEEEEADVLSLSDLQMDKDTIGSEGVNTTFDQNFFGVSFEEWSHQVSNKNSQVKQRPIDDDDLATKTKETNPVFRSSSGSFRYMRFKIASSKGSWRSRSLSVMASKSKSRWQVFMSGFGSGRFPTKMDLMDIKTRQLRSQSTAKVSESVDHCGMEDSGSRRIRKKKVWWRLVDVLGCGGGYERKNLVVD